MKNSELERIADERREKALSLKIDDKAEEIVDILGKERNRQERNSLHDIIDEILPIFSFGARLRIKDDGTYIEQSLWHSEGRFKIFIEKYWHKTKDDKEERDRRYVEIHFGMWKRLLKVIPIKVKSLVYSHEATITTVLKETGEKERHSFHRLGYFRDEDKWLEAFEELHKKAMSKDVEKSLNQIEKEYIERNKKLRERFGVS